MDVRSDTRVVGSVKFLIVCLSLKPEDLLLSVAVGPPSRDLGDGGRGGFASAEVAFCSRMLGCRAADVIAFLLFGFGSIRSASIAESSKSVKRAV